MQNQPAEITPLIPALTPELMATLILTLRYSVYISA